MKLNRPLVAFDLETTGTWLEKDKIIEIAMIKYYPDGKSDEYLRRVNPGIPLPAIVSELTGLTDADLRDAVVFKDIANEVMEFIGDADLAGFNIERFDLPMLEREFQDVGLKFEWRKLKAYDAQKIYHIHEKRDLTAAYKFYCDKELINAHSALADTKAVWDILKGQIHHYGNEEQGLESLGTFDYEQRPDFYDEDRKFRWWNGKLYMMFGKYARKECLQDIAKKDPSYLHWIASADFSDEVKSLVQNALAGKFPLVSGGNDDNSQIDLFK